MVAARQAALAGVTELSPPLSLEAVQLGPCSGLLVDWLEMLDPEVISSCPDLQQRLLFSRTKVCCTRLSSTCLPTGLRLGPVAHQT